MNKKRKVIIAVGGTGGHVFPGCNLAKHLLDKDYNVILVSDNRGYKYLTKFKELNITILPSSPLITKNIVTKVFSLILVLYSILRSLIFLIFNRPSIIFGMGGYASFPICIAAKFLNIKVIIYENNLIIGKTNKYLLPFSKKIFVSFEELEGIPSKYNHKKIHIGNIIKKEIISFSKKTLVQTNSQKLNILILGGSQAAKIFAETLPNIFHQCSKQGIDLKIYQQCLSNQNSELEILYKKMNIEFKIFNFSNNISEYFSKANLAITRSGSSILSELTNSNIPFISVPLPTSAENHQLKNAIFYQKRNLGILIEEKNLKDELIHLIKKIKEDNKIKQNIKKNQTQYSDKKVYTNIDKALKEIINEKN